MASFRYHPQAVIVLTIILALGLSPGAQGVQFAGGTGEPNDPYQIATAEQLVGLGQDPSLYSSHFVLTADIDVDPNRPGGQVFSRSVIAPDGYPPRTTHGSWLPAPPEGSFVGVFDGKGHIIRNLVIHAESESTAGLFGLIGMAGQIRDLGLEGIDIRRSSVEAEAFVAGGLAAINEGGTILRCYARGTIGGSDWAGGPAVPSGSGVRTLAAVGNDEVGGLIGENSGLVSSCYALVDVSGTGAIGGLVGQNSRGVAFFSFSAGRVQGLGWPGGLIGRSETGTYSRRGSTVQDNAGTAIRCYWDMEASGMADSAAGEGRTTAEMMSYPTYAPWTHAGVWQLLEGYQYPRLLWERGLPTERPRPRIIGTGQLGYGGGSGDPNDPYRIETAEQFLTIGCHPEDFDKSFVLTADLDFNDVEHSQFLPIGFGRVSFNGQFDGQSHSLSNLVISHPRARGVGVFGLVSQAAVVALGEEFHYEIRDNGSYSWGFNGGGSSVSASTSVIKGLHLRGVSVVGQQDVGGLIGMGAGTVADCSVSGQVTGMAMVGGLVGQALGGTLSGCRADVQVSGEFFVGGLVSHTRGVGFRQPTSKSGAAVDVLDCRTSGLVTGQVFTGGLIGYALRDAISGCSAQADVHGRYNTGGCVGSAGSSTITLSYALGTVTGERFVGGFAGEAATATINDCYCRSDVTGGQMVGGFAGHAGSKGHIARCYAASAVTAIDLDSSFVVPSVGGFVGFASQADNPCDGDCPISSSACFWDVDVSGTTEPLGNRPAEPGNVTGLPTAQMQTAAPFVAAGWDFADTWTICEGTDYPRLRWEQVECRQ
jgi:hypothetical protein